MVLHDYVCDTLKFEYLNSITCDCQVVILYCLWGILIHISLPDVKGLVYWKADS